VADVAAIEQAEAEAGEEHAQEVEEKRRDVGEGAFDESEGGSPDKDHGEQEEMGFEGARHESRVQGVGISDLASALRDRMEKGTGAGKSDQVSPTFSPCELKEYSAP